MEYTWDSGDGETRRIVVGNGRVFILITELACLIFFPFLPVAIANASLQASLTPSKDILLRETTVRQLAVHWEDRTAAVYAILYKRD